jgi:hypothetical protein
MSADVAATVPEAISSIEELSSRIEDTFAKAGHQLGRAHATFNDLNEGLTALSLELSGTEIDGAASALQAIAARLSGVAEALPVETALLDNISRGAAESAAFLKPLLKHIQMINIIARSARIEAASLDKGRESFLDFTEEAFKLGGSVLHSIQECSRDQQLLATAVANALTRQKEFEKSYGAQLVSVGTELTSAYAGMMAQRGRSVDLAERAGASTRLIAAAVGRSIVSLQSGDSTRQRLEHIVRGLRIAEGPTPDLVPQSAASATSNQSGLICRLQAMQLKDTQREFDRDIDNIVRAFAAILADATGMVEQGKQLYGSDDTNSPFLSVIKRALAQASALIGTCEQAGKSVDEALGVVDETLCRFREAIVRLGGSVIDIILIGMNASLKAAHLGVKGSAFVVIANELKATADQVAGAASKLKPVLDSVERSASELRGLRAESDPAQLAKLEPTILQSIRDVEVENDRVGQFMMRLIREGSRFEELIGSARNGMSAVSTASAKLPFLAASLEAIRAVEPMATLDADAQAALDDLFAQYTMEREREVHGELLHGLGLRLRPAAFVPQVDEDDGVLLF